jgi:predicted NAD-dependent protein-ADP-ribosyltransferase YbiA (DUF1768 family)
METFFSGKKEYRSLSNFWEGDVHIGDRIYESGEHCFHGEKYTRLGEMCLDESRRQELLAYGRTFLKSSGFTPAVAKRRGGKKGFRLSDTELETWSSINMDVQQSICQWKLDHEEEVRQDLLKSGTKILIHPALRCSVEKLSSRVWEGRGTLVDGTVVVLGKNQLGNLWMKLRQN